MTNETEVNDRWLKENEKKERKKKAIEELTQSEEYRKAMDLARQTKLEIEEALLEMDRRKE